MLVKIISIVSILWMALFCYASLVMSSRCSRLEEEQNKEFKNDNKNKS